MIAIFVVFSIVLTRKACCACSRLVAGLLVGLIGGRRVVTWRLVASSQYLEPFCQIRVSPGWEGLYCAMVADAFRARKDQLRVNPKYWRRLEAEARVIALSMGDPEFKRVMLHVAAGYKRLAERAELQDAKRYVDGASFGPEALKVMGEAFDSAWSEIAANFGADRAETETVRSKLANALLSVASEDSRNAHVLTRAALQRFALDYWRI